jgi:hypothetical protein
VRRVGNNRDIPSVSVVIGDVAKERALPGSIWPNHDRHGFSAGAEFFEAKVAQDHPVIARLAGMVVKWDGRDAAAHLRLLILECLPRRAAAALQDGSAWRHVSGAMLRANCFA